jgi:hypothetical protein
LSIWSLSYWAAWVLLWKSLPIHFTARIFPALSCTNFRVSYLIFRSLIHLELILVEGEKHGSNIFFLQEDNHFSQQNLLKRLSFSIVCFWCHCQKQGGHSCVDSYPGPLLCSTGLIVCFCASTMLGFLLLLCNIVWSWVLWYLQNYSFCWVLPLLFILSCVSK